MAKGKASASGHAAARATGGNRFSPGKTDVTFDQIGHDWGAQRRLAAILAADVKGYSRLIRQDQDATLAAWWTLRQEVIDPLVEAEAGRIVKVTGDGFLAEFPSVVAALRSAVAIQTQINERMADQPQAMRMSFRMGVNICEIVADHEDIYGDGVNIACRIEALAPPGGICVSGPAREQTRGLELWQYEDMGPRRLKNIDEPIRVYRLRFGTPQRPLHRLAERFWAAASTARWLRLTAAALMVVLAVLAIGARFPSWTVPPAAPADAATVAVLPFTDLSGGERENYLGDGLTEDLISDLARYPDLYVAARSSVFAYRNEDVDVREIGRDLAVRYVIEGSLERLDGRLRINVQLIDAESGKNLWSRRYEKPDTEFLTVRDEIRDLIVNTLLADNGTLMRIEQARALDKPVKNLEAYDLRLRGLYYYFKYTAEDLALARDYFRQATAADPNYARARADLAWTYLLDIYLGFTADPDKSVALAEEEAGKALAIDPDSPDAHWAMAGAHLHHRRHDDAIREYELTLALLPNSADVMADMADALNYAGRPQEAIRLLEQAIRRNPSHPFSYLWMLGSAFYNAGDYGRAIETFERISTPMADVKRLLAASYAMSSKMAQARQWMSQAVAEDSAYTLEYFAKTQPFARYPDMQRYLEGLRKAGLPERALEKPADG